jgi:hypothetical protein
LDKIRAHSRHRSIATLMLYVDEHDRQQTQKTLGDLVASTLLDADHSQDPHVGGGQRDTSEEVTLSRV